MGCRKPKFNRLRVKAVQWFMCSHRVFDALPILYPVTARMAPPDIHPPKVTAAPRQRALLSEPEPYIQTWPYYRLTPKGFARREKVAQSTARK